jgi:dihydrofolate synthase/folylpolyglutamate synthase
MSDTCQKFFTYEETLAYIYSQLPMYQRQGKSAFKKDLNNIIGLCDFLGNPERNLRVIHIAGTNGKGSTSHLIASILQEHGYSVGLYTSPHYMDFRERIKINGTLIEESYVTAFVNKVKEEVKHIQPSFFEITVAMAFKYFADKKVDFAVIETGLGGRLDSTNIVTPLISVITNIGLDHVDMLGDTLPKIAFEKAGIIKPKIPVVIGEEGAETDDVFIEKAKSVQAPLYFAKDVVNMGILNDAVKISNSPSPFHAKNIRTALSAIEILTEASVIKRNVNHILHGVENLGRNTYFIGRWEVLQDRPLIITDSAHNEDGLKIALSRILAEKYSKLHILLGFAKDKDIQKILSFFPKDAHYYFAKADIPRGLDARQLKALAGQFGLNGRSYISVKNAIQATLRNADDSDLIYMGGSIFVVAEILAYFKTSKRS